MLIDTDLSGVRVLVVGPRGGNAAVVRRLNRAGADVVELGTPDVVTPQACRDARLAVLVGPAAGALDVEPPVASPAGSRARSGAESGAWSGAGVLLAQNCLVVAEPDPVGPRGRVVLVGAGPGGADLLTVAARRALADADVVLADRLAEVGDVAALAPGAEVVDVGKRPGHHALPQHEIERLMVERAHAGLTVVRLKGGDPYVFGRGSEEVAAAVDAGLPVTVVPGVTSAVGVPGAAGIPVTQRGVSHVVTVLSGHEPLDDGRARALAGLGGSLVVLMGMQNLAALAAALERGGLDPDTPAAVVERGLTAGQRSVVATLATLPSVVARERLGSPAVVVVGEVVRQTEVWARRVDASPALLDGVA